MWSLSLPWWEFLLRSIIVYVFLIFILRVTGKRQVGQLAPFDLVLLLVLSNAVQNSMNGGDNSVLGGLLSAVTLVGLNWLLSWATFRNKRVARLIEGRPEVIIHNGHVFREVMRREQLTQAELDAALRAAGCADVSNVHFAILENNGQISVRVRDKCEQPLQRDPQQEAK
jgi:uncharacterized membrane protein YcaP (DUF421 family)